MTQITKRGRWPQPKDECISLILPLRSGKMYTMRFEIPLPSANQSSPVEKWYFYSFQQNFVKKTKTHMCILRIWLGMGYALVVYSLRWRDSDAS
jgi:hypothetical protein